MEASSWMHVYGGYSIAQMWAMFYGAKNGNTSPLEVPLMGSDESNGFGGGI